MGVAAYPIQRRSAAIHVVGQMRRGRKGQAYPFQRVRLRVRAGSAIEVAWEGGCVPVSAQVDELASRWGGSGVGTNFSAGRRRRPYPFQRGELRLTVPDSARCFHREERRKERQKAYPIQREEGALEGGAASSRTGTFGGCPEALRTEFSSGSTAWRACVRRETSEPGGAGRHHWQRTVPVSAR
jgi:hypothetical protein